MGGKNTTTTQKSTPTALPQLGELWNRVNSVASQPYTPYGGQMVADLNPTQQAGIQGVTNAQGSAQPYFDQAADYARTGASAIDPANIQRYMSPYTQSVIDATRANFAQDNKIQQGQITGNAAARGALGGDRVAVAQSEAARQQRLAQDPIIAGMYSQAYDKALGAAQQDRSAAAQGAYTFGALAPSVQNAAISGAQAQIGAGGLQQGNEQQKLSAAYNQYLQQLAFPYQQAGFLSSAGLPALTAAGGTQTTTAPGPSPWNQVAGLGLTLAGMGSGSKFDLSSMMGGSGGSGMPGVGFTGNTTNAFPGYSGATTSYMGGVPYPMFMKSGGRVSLGGRRNMRLDRFNETVNSIRQTLRGGGRVHGYASGGDVIDLSPSEYVNQGFADTRSAIDSGAFDPQGVNAPGPMAFSPPTAPSIPMPRPRPDSAPQPPFALPPQMMAQGDDADALPPDAMAFSQPQRSPYAPAAGGAPMPPPPQAAPAASQEATGGAGLFGLSDDARSALISAGLGMMASKSPFALSAIGEGGLQGVKTLEHRRDQKLKVDSEAKRLAQSASQFAQNLGLHRDQLDETKRRNTIADRRADITEKRAMIPPGYRQTDDGSLEPITGGPADPTVIKATADAKRGSAGLLDDETIGTMAGQYLSGDKSVMQNLGRGAQGAENIVKLRAEITRQAKEAGLKPDQIATKMADFAGRTAAMRSLGTRGVNVEYAANTANRAIDLAQEASDKVPRTQFVPFNKLKQLVETNTSSPEQAAFYAATNTLVNEYARVASGGSNQATEGMRHHAREMLNTAQGPAAYKAVLGMMRREIVAAKAAYNETRQEFLADQHAKDGQGAGAPAPAAGPPKVGERKQFKQGWGAWDGTKWVPEKP